MGEGCHCIYKSFSDWRKSRTKKMKNRKNEEKKQANTIK